MSTASVGHLPAAHPPAQLPDGWRFVRLSDVCELNPRRPNLNGRSHDAATTFVPMQAVDERQGAITAAEVRPFREVANGYTYFAEGDVLFAKITPCMQNGKHAIARGLTDGIGFGSTEFHVIRPGPDIMAEWVWYYVRQPCVLRDATRYFTGAVGQQRVPDDFLARLRIALPPLAEQRRIVTVLNEQMDAVERARAAAKERLRAAKALSGAFLRQVFPAPGQPVPDGWRTVLLGDVCDFIRGVSFDKADVRSIPTAGSIPILRAGNIGNRLNLLDDLVWVPESYVSQEQYLHIGDIVVCMSSGSPAVVGKTAQLKESWVGSVGAFCGIIRPKNHDQADFLGHWFRSPSFIEWRDGQARGANIQNLRFSQFETIEIPLPPLPEQRRVAAILNEQMAAVEKIRAAVEQELEAIDKLYPALLREAFAGRL